MYNFDGALDSGDVQNCKEYVELMYGRLVGSVLQPVFFPSSQGEAGVNTGVN